MMYFFIRKFQVRKNIFDDKKWVGWARGGEEGWGGGGYLNFQKGSLSSLSQRLNSIEFLFLLTC